MDTPTNYCVHCASLRRKRSREQTDDLLSTTGSFPLVEMSGENDYQDYAPSRGKKQKGESSRGVGNFRWTREKTRCLLEHLVSLVESGSRAGKPASGANHVSSKFGIIVEEKHVNNHLRTLKTKWSNFVRLKKNLSGHQWNEETKTIVMGREEAATYVTAHPKDDPFINKPFEFYDECWTIFGDDVARGTYARGDTDPLGQGPREPEMVDLADDDIHGTQTPRMDRGDEVETEIVTPPASMRRSISRGGASMSISQPSCSRDRSGSKKKKPTHLDVMSLFAHSMGEISRVMVQKKDEEEQVARDVMPELDKLVGESYQYLIFTQEHTSSAYDYLLEHKKIAEGFLRRNEDQRKTWLAQYVQKHMDGF